MVKREFTCRRGIVWVDCGMFAPIPKDQYEYYLKYGVEKWANNFNQTKKFENIYVKIALRKIKKDSTKLEQYKNLHDWMPDEVVYQNIIKLK